MTAQQAAITIAGSKWQPIRAASDEQLALAAKRLLWDAARTSMTGRTRDRYLVGVVRNQLPAAVERFGEFAVLAAGRRPEHPCCSWCALRTLAAAALEEPEPRPTPALQALLGRMCSRCEIHFRAQDVAKRERAHVASLVAAGYSPEDAAYQRPGEPRATGVIWPAGQEPAGLVASVRAAARRTPPPSYFRSGRRR